MVKAMLYELTGIFLSAAIIFRDNACQFRLKFGFEVHFHKSSPGA
jgi:hypothetical protein